MNVNKILLEAFIYDAIRLLMMQIITQFSLSYIYKKFHFFDKVFIHTTIFLLISIFIFWIIIYKHIPIQKIIIPFHMMNEKDIKE